MSPANPKNKTNKQETKMTREQLLKEYAKGRRYFSGVDLSGVDLLGTNLREVNLPGANLENTKF